MCVLVGENNTGKSSVGHALATVFQSGGANRSGLQPEDQPYGVASPFAIDVGVTFSEPELSLLMGRYMTLADTPTDRMTTITEFLSNQGSQVHLIFTQPGTRG